IEARNLCDGGAVLLRNATQCIAALHPVFYFTLAELDVALLHQGSVRALAAPPGNRAREANVHVRLMPRHVFDERRVGRAVPVKQALQPSWIFSAPQGVHLE